MDTADGGQVVTNSKFRRILSQLCGVIASDCLRFTFSALFGFHIILIAELHKEDSEISITLDQLTWFASLNLLNPIGLLINGLLTQRLGSRTMMFISMIVFTASWLLYYFATSAPTIILSRSINALLMTAVKTTSITYITEISEPHPRGAFLFSAQMAIAFGSFFSLLLGSFMYWRSIALVNVLFPILAAILVLLTPNSPTWLASRGRLVEAEKALCWLRGWVQPSQVQAEFHSLVDNVHNSKPATSTELKPNWQTRLRLFAQPFFQRTFYLPLATTSLVTTLYMLSGDVVLQTYSGVVFRQMQSPIDESVAMATMGGVRVLGTFIVMFFIRRIGKRKLAFFCLAVTALCHVVISLIGFLELRGEFLWISPIGLIVASFATAAGVDSVVQMLNTEVFPTSIRYIATSIGASISSIVSSAVNKLFLYAVEVFTLPGVFVFFALTNVVSLIVYYFVIPETEGRSLKEIEDHYNGVRNLNERGRVIIENVVINRYTVD